VKQLMTAAILDVPGATKRFHDQAALAVAKPKLCGSVCPVLGTFNKNGFHFLVMQLQDSSLQNMLFNASGVHLLPYAHCSVDNCLSCPQPPPHIILTPSPTHRTQDIDPADHTDSANTRLLTNNISLNQFESKSAKV
jgi:hypothetical protein